MSSQLSTTSFLFKGDIWRLLPDEATGIVGVEVRDTASLQVYFCLISVGSSQVLLDHFQLPESWWVGLAGIHEQVLYLNGFERTGQIGHPKGITAVHWATQKVFFELPAATLEGISHGTLLVSEAGTQPKVLYRVNALSGEVFSSFSQPEVPTIQENTKEATAYQVLYPEIYEQGSTYFDDLATFLLKDRAQVATSSVEYLETDSCFILSYYVRQENGLFVKFLVTYTLNGAVLYECCLLKDAERIGGPPFFVQAGQLFLVQDKNVLLSVSLPVNVNFD
ncbi:DUF4905 domain-containing protein [Nibribacter koreensis]|uniref:DUF4905 domain-containing protein n=1 Tax=Nibribacter koreensis TaxID=1084519 RepID=A0ABP8F625_9BACT